MTATDIEYLDYTWNMAPGCTMVSPGCTHCWAQTMAKRLAAMGQANYQGLTDERGRWTGMVRMLPEKLDDPIYLKKSNNIGVNYMGDLFHPAVTFEFVDEVFATMRYANWHRYFVLTKRPDRAFEYVRGARLDPEKFSHVYFGSTVENFDMARKRVIDMTNIHEAGMRTWVSYEPALSNVYWGPWNFVDFFVCGGESGPLARPMDPKWARAARDWCQKHKIPFYFKQWGAWAPDCLCETRKPHITMLRPEGDGIMFRCGKKRAGHVLDGRTWMEMPK